MTRSAPRAEFREALRLKAEYTEGHVHLGGELLEQGRLDEAIREFNSAIASAPDRAEAHYSLGLAYLRKGGRHPDANRRIPEGAHASAQLRRGA